VRNAGVCVSGFGAVFPTARFLKRRGRTRVTAQRAVLVALSVGAILSEASENKDPLLRVALCLVGCLLT
jgi:hypothetical protein